MWTSENGTALMAPVWADARLARKSTADKARTWRANRARRGAVIHGLPRFPGDFIRSLEYPLAG